MVIYIRHREGIWINFLHSVQEFNEFQEIYIPHTPITIGDVSQFNKYMKNQLLKFVEENPEVNIYSSYDIVDPVILSRAVQVVKQPMVVSPVTDLEQFSDSNHDFLSAKMFLSSLSPESKLVATTLKRPYLSLL